MTGPQSLEDMVAMAMARQALRPLVPSAPPQPSAQLAEMLAAGLPAAATSRRSALLGRLAGIGLAGKLMLATGVALAGGTATVAFTHDSRPPHVGDVDVTGRTPSPAASAPAVVPTPSTVPTDRHEGPTSAVTSSPQHDRHGTDSGSESGSESESGSRSGSDDSTAGTDRLGGDSGTEDGGDTTRTSPAPSTTASSGDGGGSDTSGSSDDGTSTREDSTLSGGGESTPSPSATSTETAGSDDH